MFSLLGFPFRAVWGDYIFKILIEKHITSKMSLMSGVLLLTHAFAVQIRILAMLIF